MAFRKKRRFNKRRRRGKSRRFKTQRTRPMRIGYRM